MGLRTMRWIAVGVLVVAGVTFAEPSTQPAKRSARVVSPWSKVTDLTDEQREQLSTIHAEFTEKINALRAEEEERSRAVLSVEQQAALDATLAREAAERKARAADRKAAKTTAPTD